MDDETQLHAAYVLINAVLHSALNAVLYPVLNSYFTNASCFSLNSSLQADG
jgi:hypothetical protein